MISVRVSRWCAWTNEVRSDDAWRAWAQQPRPLLERGVPEIPFVPALQRRRCDALARSMLHVSRECRPDGGLDAIPAVFASRYGPIDTTVAMLSEMAAAQPVSPTRFSHSVHNTQLGLFSIWAGNRMAASAVSARAETFAAGFVEALAMLHRTGADEVLLVTADTPCPDALDAVAEERHGGYALALVLARDSRSPAIELSLGAADSRSTPRREWPDALEFLRWQLSGDSALHLVHGERCWTWTRMEDMPSS